MRRAIKRASLKRCGFHLRVCSMGVSVLANIKNPFPSIPFSVWNLFYSHLHTKNSKESLKRKRTRNIIWIFSGNLIADVVSGLCWEEGFGKRECSGIRVCICVCVCIWKGEAVIILVCTAGKAGAPLWHATWLHSICSNPNKNQPGVRRTGQTQQGHKPP